MQGPGNEFSPQQPGQPSPPPPAGWPPAGGAGPAPIPPPSGTPSGYNPGGQGRINFEVLNEGWTAFQQNMGVWIGAMAIMFVILMALYVVMFIPMVILESGSSRGANSNLGLLGALIVLVFSIGMAVVALLLTGGLIRMALRQLSGHQIRVGDIFSATDVLPQLLGATILIYLATLVGMLGCFVGAWVVSALFMFALPLIVDKRMGAVEAMSASWNALKGEWLMATVFALIINLLASFGSAICGIGVIVTAPIALLSVIALYRNFFGISPSLR